MPPGKQIYFLLLSWVMAIASILYLIAKVFGLCLWDFKKKKQSKGKEKLRGFESRKTHG